MSRITFGKTAYVAGIGDSMLDAIERSSLSLTATSEGLVYTTSEALQEYLEKAYPEDNPEKFHTEVEIFLHDTYQEINEKNTSPDILGDIVFAS